MEKREFLDASREYFRSIGFQIFKKNKFYYDNDKVTICMWLQKSMYSELYYHTYYFRIKALHTEIISIVDDNSWDTLGGRLKKRHGVFSGEYENLTREEYLKDLKIVIERSIYPIMNGDLKYIKQLVINPRKVGAWIVFRPCDREKILSLEDF